MRTTVLTLAGLTLLAAGCGAAADQTGRSGRPAQASGSAQATATLTVWADDSRAKPLQDIASVFERDRGVKVKIVQKGMGGLRDDFVSQAPTGQGPDMIVGPHDWLGKLVQNGVVAPVDLAATASRFPKIALDAMRYEGQTYGLPYSVESVALLRNMKLAPERPVTFDELVATGRKLVREGKATFPVGLPVDPKAGSPYHLYPLQTSFGSSVFDGGELAIDNPGGLKFAAYLRRLAEAKVISTSLSGEIATNAFREGRTPYLITGPWDAPALAKAGVPFAVEPVPPAGPEPARPFVGVQGFYVSAKSANPILANDFLLNYLATPEAQRALYAAGGRPPAMTSVREELRGDLVMSGFAKATLTGEPAPNVPAMDAVWGDWGLSQLAVITGDGDPAKLTGDAADRIRAKIAN
ncbi:sugar ABC transporter substrate-binding protein [Streptosporangium roseum]|uniref:Maltose ABC transporter periplasmic protein n=1 Tax=Streptosporangium roseum (strain ATCC 12428 / DSM 43021 / JCM 3005 / KCTC 9067 / NCIMB 10171 / NRRL 2505 / NI 9100) TaxID=479432 RepID=D2B813_STRRD|nr:maltose ABC transporter substrate-binding protein [Streptosporangium roseum]ACZ83944.1 maltose ABC transporter periplasmic protein [Streptosporangium roseum DSM 43021]